MRCDLLVVRICKYSKVIPSGSDGYPDRDRNDMADTLYVVCTYEHYLGLRPERPSHPPWAAEWDSVRAELAAGRPRQPS
jgi:hypothetical protein